MNVHTEFRNSIDPVTAAALLLSQAPTPTPTTMNIKRGFADAIGNTPLIRLNRFSEETGCEILGKAEFMNPGGSVKDRAARAIVEEAERSGRLKPGGTVVEGTAGNTGIGLAHVCNTRGYRCVIVMPDNQSNEKYQMIETLGAEVLRVKTVPYADPNHYQKIAMRLAAEIPDAIWANQFDNTANRDAHEQTTGPEIWAQTGGAIDAFVASTGTGGTLGGISRYLKRQNANITVTLADPQGSSLYHWLRHGELKATGPGSITEGIGIGRVTANLEGSPLDEALHITDVECVSTVYRLLRDEGLFLGSTSGVNVAAAVQIARRLGPGHTIVTILCDNGAKYQSRLFNRKWLAEKGLLDASGLAQQVLSPSVSTATVSSSETPRVLDGYSHRLRA
jgi:cysteine synthase A